MTSRFTPIDPGAPPGERADAARNRRVILEAAARLFSEREPDSVTVDEIAAAAGVGKGTIYRRFVDRAGLAMAVLDQSDRDLQEELLRGPPPLGPGAPPVERLVAFVDALAGFLERHRDLLSVAEAAPAGGRYRSNLYASYRLHVAVLLREIVGDDDRGLLADVLLAPLNAELYRHLREDRGLEPERIREVLVETTRCIASTYRPKASH